VDYYNDSNSPLAALLEFDRNEKERFFKNQEDHIPVVNRDQISDVTNDQSKYTHVFMII